MAATSLATRQPAFINGGADGRRRAAALHRARAGEPARLIKRGTRWGTITFMVAIHVLAVVALLPRFWSVPAAASFLVLYWVTACLGVTIGYHRLLSLRGFWWSHMGWMFETIPAMGAVPRLTGDLQRDPFYRWLDRWFLLLQLPIGAALYWYGQTADVHGGGLGLVLWAIPLRLVIVYHVTWLVNSATHFCGYRNFDCPDRSRNCWWVALLSFGEGWHNNHHAFPHSARHGLRWFEFDITWQHIRLLRALGWARRVREARFRPS